MHTRRDSRLSASGSKTKNAGPADEKPSDARSQFNGKLPSYWTTKRLRTRQVWRPKESRRQSSAGESMTASGNHLNVTGDYADVRPCNFETKGTFCAEPVRKRDSTASLPDFDEAGLEEVPLVDAQVGDRQIPKPGTSFTKVQSPLNIQNVSSDGTAAVNMNSDDQISAPLNIQIVSGALNVRNVSSDGGSDGSAAAHMDSDQSAGRGAAQTPTSPKDRSNLRYSGLMVTLGEMGLSNTILDVKVLKGNRFAGSSSFEDSSAGEGWDLIVEELQEMGYHKSE